MNKFPEIGDTIKYRKYRHDGLFEGSYTGYVTFAYGSDILTFIFEPKEIPYISVSSTSGRNDQGIIVPAIGFPEARMVLTEKCIPKLFQSYFDITLPDADAEGNTRG